MEIDEWVDDLVEIVLNFHLNQSFSTFDELIQGLIGADLEQDVHVLVILEHMLEFNDVLVAEGLMDFDLGD